MACGTHTGSRICVCTGIRPCARIQNFGPPEEAPTAVCLCVLQCRLLAPAVSCQAGRRSCSSLAVHGAVGEAACAGCAAAQGATIPAKHLGWEISRARPCDLVAARCVGCRSPLQSLFQSDDDGARYITKPSTAELGSCRRSGCVEMRPELRSQVGAHTTRLHIARLHVASKEQTGESLNLVPTSLAQHSGGIY